MTTDMRKNGMAAYVAVTAAYWAFMLSDGALRMLVLLHFHTLGFSPIKLAFLFVFYEIAGIFTNLSAGWLAARFGLASTLYAGLLIQILALIALAQLDAGWTMSVSVLYVMLVQGASGVAKDLAKMSSKSAVKLLAPDSNDGLFRWVAMLTGSKNAIKGLGFLLGAGLLAIWGYYAAIWGMAAVLAVILLVIVLKMPAGLPTGRKDAKFTELFSKNRNINWLSFARVFLFGARDVWFVVGIPIYFHSALSDGTHDGARQAFFLVGTFMAIWIILYGIVQANAPRLLKAKTRQLHDLAASAQHWAMILACVPAVLAIMAYLAPAPTAWLTFILVIGLLVFGALFAVNSSLHSYLILAFTDKTRVTMDVGFYYMANAAGRLLGTVLSGVSYQIGGLPACLGTAAVLLLVSTIGAGKLNLSTSPDL